MACGGDSKSLCGGGNRMNLYENSAWSAPAPKPTENPGIGAFRSKGCWYDDVNNRAIPDEQFNAKSMSVKECVSRAQSDGFRYAGLEFGVECWYGDTFSSSPAIDGCEVACGGNPSELCGGNSRLVLYENMQWVDLNPSRADILVIIKEMELLAVGISDALQQWLNALKKARTNTQQKRSRVMRRDEVAAEERRSLMAKAKAWRNREPSATRSVNAGARGGSITTQERGQYIQLVEGVNQALGNVESSEAAIPESTTPTLNQLDTAIDTAGNAATQIGTPQTTLANGSTKAATGILLGFVTIIGIIAANSGGNNSGTTTTTTTSMSTSTSTSSTCTATATQTPIIIVTRQGTTAEQYNELVEGLPANKDNVKRTDSWLPNVSYL
jgi:hypothetical protein